MGMLVDRPFFGLKLDNKSLDSHSSKLRFQCFTVRYDSSILLSLSAAATSSVRKKKLVNESFYSIPRLQSSISRVESSISRLESSISRRDSSKLRRKSLKSRRDSLKSLLDSLKSRLEENLHTLLSGRFHGSATVDSAIGEFPRTSPSTSVTNGGVEYVLVLHKHPPSRSSFCKETPDPHLRGSTSVSSASRTGITHLSLIGAQRMAPGIGLEQLIARTIQQSQPGGEEQRAALFYAKGFACGEVCIVVIDSGSEHNLISESFVTRLGIPLMNHPEEYDLGGIHGYQARITKQAFVPFTVGQYGDCMLFDVVKTPAIDLLLGRQWQFDNRVVHVGDTNTYSFMRGNILITLYPLL